MESVSGRKTISEAPSAASTALHKLAANLNNLDIHQASIYGHFSLIFIHVTVYVYQG